ncbi:MAG: hypothetical protein LWX07_05005 [Bacteroidetes bacterium]|nr:hypothetical protein [Bacteroidota bacterium]
MKKNNFLAVLIFACAVFAHSAYGQISKETLNNDKNNSIQTLSTKILSLKTSGPVIRNEMNNVDSSREKSPVLGALLSAAVPGAGEFYAKKYVKSAIFLAVEAGLWATYAVFQKKGNDQTTSYQNYADQHWSVVKYATWLKDQNFPGSGNINTSSDPVTLRAQINQCEEQSGFSHTLPNYGDQQYYEVIGKYRTYTCGWDQAGPDITKNNYETYPILSQVNFYMDERQKANNYYDRGTTTMMVVILNHIASAVDGVLSVNSYNNKLSVQGNVSFAPVYSYKEGRSVVTPYFNLKVGF